jgi:hypothetical protein
MPINLDFSSLPEGDQLRQDVEQGGTLSGEDVWFQFVCSTDGEGGAHDPASPPDEKVRPSHAALHGTIWRVDDPNAPIPPLDFGCRCAMVFQSAPKSPAAKVLPPAKPPPPAAQSAQVAVVPQVSAQVPYATYLDANVPQWRKVAATMRKAKVGDELAVGYVVATQLGISGSRREIVNMIAIAAKGVFDD